MFPITKAYQRRFRTEGSAYYETLQRIIDSNTKRIVSECQAYLDRYEREGRPRFAVDIDRIVGLLGARSRAPRLSLESCGVAPHF